MSRQEFHAIYETMSGNIRAELLHGVVYVSQSLRRTHARNHGRLSTILDCYVDKTPGIETLDNASVFLSDEDEVQPDLLLRIMPEYGGQSRNSYDDYIEGSPELVAEIANSSKSIDLHLKLKRYAKFGVREYIVYCLEPQRLHCFNLQSKSNDHVVQCTSIYKSIVFPGLWIDVDALFCMDLERSIKVVHEGMSGADHSSFIRQLQNSRK